MRVVELDTTWFLGNAPGAAALSAYDGGRPGRGWSPLLERTALQPDTRHRFVLPEPAAAATHVRLDVYPDGGMARLRLWGTPTADGLAALQARWDETGDWVSLPDDVLGELDDLLAPADARAGHRLAGGAGRPAAGAHALPAGRPARRSTWS